MNLKNFKIKHLSLIMFVVLSFVAGGINGFLGTGGGIIFIFMLSFLTNNETRDNYATSLCATVIISAFGLISYTINGKVDFSMISVVWLPAIIGGGLGALFVDRIKIKWLNLIFALLIIYSGFRMVFK